MPGFLDPNAPNTQAEYARYLDGDLLGKIITKNLLINRLGYAASAIFTPLGRYGDATTKYAKPGTVVHDVGDGHVDTEQGRVTFEVKCARLNITNRSRGESAENWAFVNLLTSPNKAPKSYQVLIAVGIQTLGLEDDRYWQHLSQVHQQLHQLGHVSNINALPHEPDYLSICSFFILPRIQIPTNYFRINVASVSKSKYGHHRAWGYEEASCRALWSSTLGVLRAD